MKKFGLLINLLKPRYQEEMNMDNHASELYL